MIASSAELARRLDDLENKYDAQSRVVFDAIRQMMQPAGKGKKSIGFLLYPEFGAFVDLLQTTFFLTNRSAISNIEILVFC